MAINTDKNSYTILFSIAMVFVVGAMLAGVSSALRPDIAINKKKEKQQNILFAMNIADAADANAFVPADQAQTLFDQYVGGEQYIIEGTKATKSTDAFEIDIKKEADRAKQEEGYQMKMPLFIGNNKGNKFYIIPVRGNGLWDAIWGYVALNENFDALKGAYFDHAGETPGLGANITEAYFREDFIGEKIRDGAGNYKGIEVKKGNADPKNTRKNDNAVDALAGATITGNGVTVMVKKGIKAYLPYFETLKR